MLIKENYKQQISHIIFHIPNCIKQIKQSESDKVNCTKQNAKSKLHKTNLTKQIEQNKGTYSKQLQKGKFEQSWCNNQITKPNYTKQNVCGLHTKSWHCSISTHFALKVCFSAFEQIYLINNRMNVK